MAYNFLIQNNALVITKNSRAILNNITLRINYLHSKNIEYVPAEINQNGNETIVAFKRKEFRNWMYEAEYANLIFIEYNNTLLAKADFACRGLASFAYNYTYPAFDSAYIDYSLPEDRDDLFNIQSQNPFWLVPDFSKDPKDFEISVASVSYKIKENHIHMLPLVNADIKVHIETTGFVINNCVNDKTKISANVFLLTTANDPLIAIEDTCSNGRALKAINVPPATERAYPEKFEGFGWCTWNAFYHDVTSEKILKKLDEFKEKGITLKWLMIDDGWQQIDNKMLISFKEDPKKFPEGFKAFTKKVKEEYGVKYVGVWHAVAGYWIGIHKESELYAKYTDALLETPNGYIMPGKDEDCAFKFWDDWHSYLKESGIDFVKIDNQATIDTKYDNIIEGNKGLTLYHTALEKSVFKNFDGAIINCMGCNLNLILSRPFSAVNRNSDDFYPERKHGFIKHINQNVYISPLHNQFHSCDFDMFWTEHETATVSAVLRAISGGPVYVSDEVGKTNADELKPLVLDDGNIWRFDRAAMVTKDLFYTNCSQAEIPLKVWNKSGENFVIGVFGISVDKTVKGKFKLSDIPTTSDRYLVHDFFEDKYFVLNNEDALELETDYNACKLLSLYPIAEDDSVYIGNGKYYAESADPNPKKVYVKDMI